MSCLVPGVAETPLDKTTEKQLTVTHISDLLRRNIFQKRVLLTVYLKIKE